eukprot:gene44322-59128_t
MDDQGTENAAILLMSLGEEEAAQVFRHLGPKEVQRLGETIAKMKVIPRERVEEVLEKFTGEAAEQHMLVPDNDEYVKAVLRKALGDDRASNLLEDILQPDEPRGGIERLNELEAGEVAELIRDEHPQILATLVVHLDRMKASEVLEKLPTRLRHDVIMRVATLGGVQPSALKELTDVLTEMLAGQGVRRNRLGGVRTAAEIVNLMSTAVEEEAIAHVREKDEALAQRIVDE